MTLRDRYIHFQVEIYNLKIGIIINSNLVHVYLTSSLKGHLTLSYSFLKEIIFISSCHGKTIIQLHLWAIARCNSAQCPPVLSDPGVTGP